MQKTHSKTKSITYSEHTKHCSGFVHKVRNRDKIKTVRIAPPDQAKKTTRPYRNVAIAHIKTLRAKADVDRDLNPLHDEVPFTRYSFFYDENLNHALVHTKPLHNAPDADTASRMVAMAPGSAEFGPKTGLGGDLGSKQDQIKAMINKTNTTTQVVNTNTSRHLTNPNGPNSIHGVSYKPNDVLQLQNGLPSGLKQKFALARIRNSKLSLVDWLLSLSPPSLAPDIRDALDEIVNASQNNANQAIPPSGNENSITSMINGHKQRKRGHDANETPVSPAPSIDPNPPKHQANFTFDDLNFKPPRVMALDIGTQYIGVAISDDQFEKAVPVGVINLLADTPTNTQQQSLIQNINPTFRIEPATIAQQLNTFRKRYNVICTCIGLPQSEYNEHMVVKIKTFTSNMMSLNGLGQGQFEVCYIDEHHTTQEARKRILQEDERDEEYAIAREGYSHTGEGGERRKKLRAKSKHYDDMYHKKKDIDAEAAAIILERFIELTNDFGEKYNQKVHEIFVKMKVDGQGGVASQIHTM